LRGLWFSEGLSMYYADLLLRRAHLPVRDSTRVIHLENLISRYLSNGAYAHFSPEEISRAAYATRPDALGDYEAGVHLPGELIGAMLDLVIRDATDGRRSSDDLMRMMLDRFGAERDFTPVIDSWPSTVLRWRRRWTFVTSLSGLLWGTPCESISLARQREKRSRWS